jgi:hypothetical protein
MVSAAVGVQYNETRGKLQSFFGITSTTGNVWIFDRIDRHLAEAGMKFFLSATSI